MKIVGIRFLKHITRKFLGEYCMGQRIRTRYLRKMINAGCQEERILDAGCGEGLHAIYFASKFPYSKIVGVDFDADCIQDCHEKQKKLKHNNVMFIQGDLIKTLKDMNQYFTLIYCIDVLEHIIDDFQVLENFHRLLHPGGRLIIHVPNIKQRHILEWLYPNKLKYKDHVRNGYEPELICDSLSKLGFLIKDIKFTFRDSGIVATDICEFFDGKTSIGMLIIRLIVHPILVLFASMDGIISKQKGNGIFIDALKVK